jgi:uncharacterized protein
MDMTGTQEITASPQMVWEALNSPDILRLCIPGCESLEKTEAGGFEAKVVLKIGPVKATFTGAVTLTNLNPPHSYTITGEGSGGIAGHAKGSADVSLAPSESGTLLSYTVKADIGGKIAQLGSRLIDATSKKLAAQFFDKFSQSFNQA